MKHIIAKFQCHQVIPATEDYPSYARLHAVIANEDGSDCEENKSFSKYTPSGNLEIAISPETKAHNYFKEGREYYLRFERVQKEPTKN